VWHIQAQPLTEDGIGLTQAPVERAMIGHHHGVDLQALGV
jgi:hypothetical protein